MSGASRIGGPGAGPVVVGAPPAATVDATAPVDETQDAPADGFTQQPDAGATPNLVRDPTSLTSNLGTVKDAEGLPGRLTTDLLLMLPELVDLKTLTTADKAERLVSFAVPYAERLSELAEAMPKDARAELADKMVAPMENAGLKHVVDTVSGQTGAQIAKNMMTAGSATDVRKQLEGRKLDAPGWKDDRRDLGMAALQTRLPDAVLVAQAPPPPLFVQRPTVAKPEEEPGHRKGRKGRLGANMIWNALHTLRNGDDAQQREAKELLREVAVVFGILVLAGILITVAILAS